MRSAARSTSPRIGGASWDAAQRAVRGRLAGLLLRPDPLRPEGRRSPLRLQRPLPEVGRSRRDLARISGSVHVDHHAVLVDPSSSDKVWLGNDGGLHVSYDRGESWQHFDNLPISQFYAVGLDQSGPSGSTAAPRTTAPGAARTPRGTRAASTRSSGTRSAAATGSTPRSTRAIRTPSTRRASSARSTGAISPGGPRSASGRASRRARRRRRCASTGTRRSSCRRTTRRSSTSAATGSSSPTTAATPGRCTADLTTRDEVKIAGNVPLHDHDDRRVDAEPGAPDRRYGRRPRAHEPQRRLRLVEHDRSVPRRALRFGG